MGSKNSVDRVIESRWVQCGASTMDDRIDTLRRRADFLARQIAANQQGQRGFAEREHAALMWAIAELSGIGDEVRSARSEREDEKLMKAKKLQRRAEHAEGLYAAARVKIGELKARVVVLSDELNRIRLSQSPVVGRASGVDDGREALPAPENKEHDGMCALNHPGIEYRGCTCRPSCSTCGGPCVYQEHTP